jgi:hypothetical protein
MRPAFRLIFACVIAATLSAAMPGAQRLGPRDVNGLPSRPADARVNYATSDPLQFGELRLPKGRRPFPVAIVIQGGCWVSTFATLQNGPIVRDKILELLRSIQ